MGRRKHNDSDILDDDYYDYYQVDGTDEMICPDCHGTGYDPLDGGQCDRCNGTGVIDRY